MMKLLLTTLTLLTMSWQAQAIPEIKFDEGVTPQTGVISYDGEGGALVGTGIDFTSGLGVTTALNSGVSLDCTGCTLDFVTGLNTLEGPALWQWLAGGSIDLSGSLFQGATLIASGSLLSGTFTAPPAPTFAGNGTSGLFLGIGDLTVNTDISDFFGFAATSFYYAYTNLSIGTCSTGSNAGFSCDLDNADLNIVAAAVPSPTPLMLMGVGLVALAGFIRRKQA